MMFCFSLLNYVIRNCKIESGRFVIGQSKTRASVETRGVYQQYECISNII